MPIHLTHTSLEYGRKPEYLEKTHTDCGRTCKRHTDSSPCWELIFFFFLINILAKGCWIKLYYPRTCCTYVYQLIIKDIIGDIDEQLDEEVHRVRSGRVLSPRVCVPMELGRTTLLGCGYIYQPGNSSNLTV